MFSSAFKMSIYRDGTGLIESISSLIRDNLHVILMMRYYFYGENIFIIQYKYIYEEGGGTVLYPRGYRIINELFVR